MKKECLRVNLELGEVNMYKVIYEVMYDGTEAGYDVSMNGDKLRMVDYDYGGTADGKIYLNWKYLEKRLKLEDDPRVKFPKWITEELALYKDDGETLDYNAGTKVYEIWTKGQ